MKTPNDEHEHMSRLHIARALTVLTCVGAAAAALVAPATSLATSSSQDRTLIAHSTGGKDGKTGFTFTDRLTEGGKPVGTDAGSCVFAGEGKAPACVVTLTLRDGKLRLRGSMNVSKSTFSFTIARGTGAYKGAHGSAEVVSHGATSPIKLHLA